jgi:hypothetical protein
VSSAVNVADVNLSDAPMKKGGSVPRTESGGSAKFGKDMMSRMSVGRASVGSASVCLWKHLPV